MGNCLISVSVTGGHHNGKATDIDQMAADFAAHLRAKGHSVSAATIVCGGETDLLYPASRFPLTGAGK